MFHFNGNERCPGGGYVKKIEYQPTIGQGLLITGDGLFLFFS